MAETTVAFPDTASGRAIAWPRPEIAWGIILVIPYAVVFAFFVIYPLVYGFYLVRNTLVFLLVAVNLKLVLALIVSGFFVHPQRWIRWVSIIFILPWAVPSIPTILSFRWMLNSEWGMINNVLFRFFDIFPGPGWLLDPDLAMGSIILVHIWKYLPFWTLILLAGRLAIPHDLYEA